ncbi:MAG: hypothetical protein HY829_13675 [Actinobacteria bacterium]|nr:hypothetical protein [Actinomycetota bacterium]
MRRALSLAAASAAVLAGCAHTAPPLPAALPSASSSASVSGSPSGSPSASASATSGGSASPTSSAPTPTVSPKTLATLKLPATFGAYQASTTTGTGEQQVVYVNPNDAKDTLTVVVTALADAATVSRVYVGATVTGPGICGTVASGSSKIASCAMPLDKGALIVTGSGIQPVDTVSTASAALWATLP